MSSCCQRRKRICWQTQAKSLLLSAYLDFGFIRLEGQYSIFRRHLQILIFDLFRIYVVWKNILNFSSDQPTPSKHRKEKFNLCPKTLLFMYTWKKVFLSVLSWNSLLYYIRNLNKSNSNEGIKDIEVVQECPEEPTIKNQGINKNI